MIFEGEAYSSTRFSTLLCSLQYYSLHNLRTWWKIVHVLIIQWTIYEFIDLSHSVIHT